MQNRISQADKLLNRSNANPDKAISLLFPLIKKKKTTWQAYHLFGLALLKKSESGKAIEYLNRAIEAGSVDAGTYFCLSVAYFNLNRLEESEVCAEKAIEVRSNYFAAWMKLGEIRSAQGKLNEALGCFQKCNQIDPKSNQVALKIAHIYRDQGYSEKALEMYDIAISMDGDQAVAISEKVKILIRKHQIEDAEKELENGLRNVPGSVTLQASYAELKREKGEYSDALNIYEDILNKHPKNAGARINYANILQDLGRFEEAEKHYLQSNTDNPGMFESFSNYLFVQHYNPEKTKEEIFEAHKLWDSIYAPENPVRPKPSNTDQTKRLRIGLLSGGFRKHPVGWMILSGLENLPKEQFDLYFYSNHTIVDGVTERLHAISKSWKMVAGYNDEKIADLIREDEIDILVDLSGHTGDGRLRAVALEPAPVIVKWVGGLINTTGLKSIDFLISDWIETPAGEESFYTEKLVRMPDDYITYTPPDYAAEVKECPNQKNGYITFGCFNNPIKVNPEILSKWAEIMKKVPESRLFLKSKQYGNKAYRNRITSIMSDNQIEKSRLIFEGISPHHELLDSYNRVDIALDPWPYSGGLTTCEALWMGVPVITKPGPTFAGRHSATHLHNAGFPEWIARSWDEYVEKVVSLAINPDKLAILRAGLREKIANSTLCDGKRFGKHLGNAFREMWEQRIYGYKNNYQNGDWKDHISVKCHIEPGNINVPDINPPQPDDSEINNLHAPQKPENLHHQLNGLKKKKEVPDVFRIKTTDEITICTPCSLELLTPYVLLEQGEWYENEMKFIRRFVKPGMNVLDAGAGFGVYALPIAKMTGKKGRVFAFEPGMLTNLHLEMSKQGNDLQNMVILKRAVSDQSGEFIFKVNNDTPEQNKLDENGDEYVPTITLDAWWQAEGEPDIDLIKLDVNGEELKALNGASTIIENLSPIIIFSVGENGENVKHVPGFLQSQGFKIFEYIPGAELLAEFDSENRIDPYIMNLIAVKENRLKKMKGEGWVYDESYQVKAPEAGLWKKTLSKQCWTKDLLADWDQKSTEPQNSDYFRALDFISAAGQIDLISESQNNRRTEKAALLLGAAQILIQLYNNGADHPSIAMSLIRTLNALGKRSQAVEVMQKLLENSKFGHQMLPVVLPFFLPLAEQDTSEINTDLDKWLMVKIVEAWLILKDHSTYWSGTQELKMLSVLKGNPEVLPQIERQCELIELRNES